MPQRACTLPNRSDFFSAEFTHVRACVNLTTVRTLVPTVSTDVVATVTVALMVATTRVRCHLTLQVRDARGQSGNQQRIQR